ncbi:hypothetical protein [Enterobacter mori]|uniref:hypothetical protein n=1 Tax=Enterobacter mori TaxID=539813 RepID=UPI003B84132C
MTDLLIITLVVAIGFPAFMAVMSFVVWQNGFRVPGAGFVIRMTIVLVVWSSFVYFIQGGGK